MEQPIKAMQGLLIGFMGVLIFLGIVTYSVRSSMARETVYEAVQDIEEYGYVENRIDTLARKTSTNITVVPVEVESEGSRYKVEVSFYHVFAVLRLNKGTTYSATTRLVEY